jgi:hypothetical protein
MHQASIASSSSRVAYPVLAPAGIELGAGAIHSLIHSDALKFIRMDKTRLHCSRLWEKEKGLVPPNQVASILRDVPHLDLERIVLL